MVIRVQFLESDMESRIMNYHYDKAGHQQVGVCLVVEGRSALHIVMLKGRGLVHVSKPKSEEQYMRPANITLKKGLSSFGGVARRKGSTKAARTWMAKAKETIS